MLMSVGLKSLQARKIGEIADALARVGYTTLDEQAKALGLPRSTTWTIMRCCHKASGLSARLINRMLVSPDLPPPVRTTIQEYVKERLAGTYGHNKVQLRRFAWQLDGNHIPTAAGAIEKLEASYRKRAS
jgi:hypothetical protein